MQFLIHHYTCLQVWKFKNGGESLKDRFDLSKNHRVIATEGGHIEEYTMPGLTGSNLDPIFSVGGDLALNWQYSNNGARIALTGGHLSDASTNDDDTHGLGNEFGADTASGAWSSSWWHDVANIQGDCHGGSCSVQGTDHGSALNTGTMYGQYAIYVSSTAESFPCAQNPGTDDLRTSH
jgi:hypothetical protein